MYIESSFSVHQQRVISLLIHGVLPLDARLLIAFGTASYAITLVNLITDADEDANANADTNANGYSDYDAEGIA